VDIVLRFLEHKVSEYGCFPQNVQDVKGPCLGSLESTDPDHETVFEGCVRKKIPTIDSGQDNRRVHCSHGDHR
jgi:hypothetical protein